MAGPRFAHVWASLLLPNGPDRAVQDYAPGAVSQSPWRPPALPLQNINWSSQEHRWGCPAVGEARGLGAVATKGHEQTFDDGYVHYLHRCDSFMSIYTHMKIY